MFLGRRILSEVPSWAQWRGEWLDNRGINSSIPDRCKGCFLSSPERPLWLSDSPSLLFNEWWGFSTGGWCWTLTTLQGVSEIFGQPSAVSSVDQNREHVYISICLSPVLEVQPPRSPDVSLWGHVKTRTVFTSNWKWRDPSPAHFFTLVSPHASAPGLWNGTTVRDWTCPRVPLLRWRTCWAFIVNCTVIKWGTLLYMRCVSR